LYVDFDSLTAPSCALQDEAQAARPRYRSGIGQSAEGKKPPSALAPFQVCPLRYRRRFTTAPFAKKTSPRACRSQAAGAVVAYRAVAS